MAYLSILISFANGLGLLALVAVLYGIVERLPLGPRIRIGLHGLIFGLGAVLSMTTPAVIMPGIIVDTRTIIVALAAAFIGWPAAVISAAMAGVYRVSLGGAGVHVGLATLVFSLAVGLIWRELWLKRRSIDPLGLLILGGAIAAQVLLIVFLPVEMTARMAGTFIVSLTTASLIATQMLGAMMQRERQQIAREKALSDYAYTDPLTGLPNRREADRTFAKLAARTLHTVYALLVIDIDHFKAVNDRYGHDVGDSVLCVLADILAKAIRDGDVAVRLGGEEFIVILPHTGGLEASAIAERICRRVSQHPISLAAAQFTLTVSIGVASSNVGGAPDEVLRAADEALYFAKGAGRNRVSLAPPAPGDQRAPTRPDAGLAASRASASTLAT